MDASEPPSIEDMKRELDELAKVALT